MNPAELLASMTARSAPLEQSISGFGRFTSTDVLHALGLIKHSGSVLLLRVKYCGQSEFANVLDARFYQAIHVMQANELWPYPIKYQRQNFYLDLSRLALAENIATHICLTCGGSAKEITPEGKLGACKACNGTGRESMSKRSRPRIMRMPRRTWDDRWYEYYKRVLSVANLWEEIGIRGMLKRMKST
jgi:hypothetical protein